MRRRVALAVVEPKSIAMGSVPRSTPIPEIAAAAGSPARYRRSVASASVLHRAPLGSPAVAGHASTSAATPSTAVTVRTRVKRGKYVAVRLASAPRGRWPAAAPASTSRTTRRTAALVAMRVLPPRFVRRESASKAAERGSAPAVEGASMSRATAITAEVASRSVNRASNAQPVNAAAPPAKWPAARAAPIR